MNTKNILVDHQPDGHLFNAAICLRNTSSQPPVTPVESKSSSSPADSSKAYLSINFEQVSTWVRNFNPFS